MIVTLTAPCRWHCAVFSIGEVVDLPAAFAQALVKAGRATTTLDSVTCAVEGPPADKLMRQKQKKAL